MRASGEEAGLRARVAGYLRAHDTMTIATADPVGNAPHAACVFYAVDEQLRLVFLSKPASVHGSHIGELAPVAVTVTEQYVDWERIQGLQLWGEARLLGGTAKAAALTVYLKRFPFVRDIMAKPGLADLIRGMGVYRVTPHRAAFTDNTTGVFGREVLEPVTE